MENNTIKKTKLFLSIMKEKIWLEQMALEGYKLIKMTMGMRYTFEKIEPTRLIYEIDRFNLPKNPTLSEIKSKADSLSMAEEMGWQIAVHDEDLNYYFYKEYVEGDINELYNDQESRLVRAEKYRKRYSIAAKQMLNIIILINAMIILVGAVNGFSFDKIGSAYTWLIVGCTIYCTIMIMFFNKISDLYYKEFSMTKEEWLQENDYFNNNTKKVTKLILKSKSLQEFLKKEGENGWHPKKISFLKYTFVKGSGGEYQYIMDSKYLTNMRLKAIGANIIKDSKDIGDIGNDWQVQSVNDAEQLGWEFVSAIENKMILYRAPKENNVEQLNQNGKMPHIGILSYKVSLIFVISGGVGFLIGLAGAKLLIR